MNGKRSREDAPDESAGVKKCANVSRERSVDAGGSVGTHGVADTSGTVDSSGCDDSDEDDENEFAADYPGDACESCGTKWTVDPGCVDWEEMGYSAPCDDCCCGGCGGRKKYCGGC